MARGTAICLAFVMLLVNVACCWSMPPQTAALKPAAHSCCHMPGSPPEKSPLTHGCERCIVTAPAAAPLSIDAPNALLFHCLFLPPADLSAISSAPLFAEAFSPKSATPAPTLLQMHCALNL